MEEWKEYKLGEIASLSTGFPFKGEKYSKEGVRVVRGDNVTIGELRWPAEKDKRWNEPFDRSEEFSLRENDIVIGMDGSRVGYNRAQIKREDLPLLIAQRVACIRNNEESLQSFLYYQIFSNRFLSYIRNIQTGSAIPHVSLKQIGDFTISLPPLNTQQRIASILSSLDDKIAVNKKICENLEAQVQALFKHWFVDFAPFKDGKFVESELGLIPEGWRDAPLSSIADYVNGLAMQKFRPEEGEEGLPVLKIKELGQGGFDANSELCSPSKIGDKYTINDGDIIFSWSGTLMVKIWCGGKCGLNQHLFVVVPNDFPKWFVYLWTRHHLDNFIRIAKDKAVTMGHIKRGELDKAMVLIPSDEDLNKINALMTPIHQQIVNSELESRRLATLRDTLLPKLMSGQIKVIK